MNRLRATNSVPFASRDIAPTTGTPQYATDGVPGTTPPTIWPAYAFNQVQDEIVAVIVGAGLTPDDTNWAQLFAAIKAIVHGVALASTVYATPGTFTFTVPDGVYFIKVSVIGGGGGGSECITGSSPSSISGGGGGAAGWAIGIYPVTPGQTYTVTVGAGGTTQVAGGTSSFGTLLTATGGGPSSFLISGVANSGGGGGVASGGTILNMTGGFGSDGQSGTLLFAGNGAAGPRGGSGRAGDQAGQNATGPGAGGGGAYDPASTGTRYSGGSGGGGEVLIEYLETIA